MAFYQKSRIKERLNIPTTDEADDPEIDNLGAGADQELATRLRRVAKKNRKLSALPAIDVTNGTIGGVTATQDIKDAASNIAISTYKATKGDLEAAEYWNKKAWSAINQYVDDLKADAQIYGRVCH